MSNEPEQPFRGVEHPPIENFPRPANPLAPVDYPADAGLPPPVYPMSPSYPTPQPYPVGYPGYDVGYPYPVDPYDPYRPARPPGTNGMAIASLVCSVAGLICCLPSIVGLILGIMAMRETRRTGQEGYGLALAGVIIGGLVTAGTVLYLLILIIAAAAGA